MKTLEEYAQEEYDCEGFLNVVISANNRSLVDQTEVRMNRELFVDSEDDEEADVKIEGSCFKWRSGIKGNNITYGELADKIKEEEVTMVVCCAHAKRLKYVYDLLTNLNNSKIFKKKINIWIDEADASIKLWSKPSLIDVSTFARVHKITLVSATYDSVLKKYGRIRVLPCLETTLSIYHRIQDCIIVEEDIAALSTVDYLFNIYLKCQKSLSKPGVRLFAPGDVERMSHEAIAEFLYSRGFAVVIINGERKEILIPDRNDPIPLTPYVDVETSAPEEIGRVITKIYRQNRLERFPFAVTGHLCLGRGITFQNDEFLFTHGVIFNIADKANAYQTACRLAGNIKDFDDYMPAILYTTSKMMKVILEKENTAIGIAKHVAENSSSHVDKEMIDYLYGGKTLAREEDFTCEWFEFKDMDEATRFSPNIREKQEDQTDNRFKLSSITKLKRLSYEEIMATKLGKKTANMPTPKKVGEYKDRLYVGYKDLNDHNTAVYVIRRLTRVAKSSF